MGLVFGAWGEGSQEVHRLLDQVVGARVQRASQSFGGLPVGKRSGLPMSAESARSMWMGQCRRELSCAVAKAQARHLLGRVHRVGQSRADAQRHKKPGGGRGAGFERRGLLHVQAARDSGIERAGGFGRPAF